MPATDLMARRVEADAYARALFEIGIRDLGPVLTTDLQYTCIIIDGASIPGQWREQDMTAPNVLGFDADKSIINAVTGPTNSASQLYLKFPLATPNISIGVMMEVWIGWRSVTTSYWSPTDPYGRPDPPYGGYIRKLTASTDGGEKTLVAELNDYKWLAERTQVLGWPTWDFASAPVIGFPVYKPVAAWLAGVPGTDAPYPGVIRARLGNGVRFDGIDPIFWRVLLPPDVIPGNSGPGVGAATGVPGQFGWMMLDKVIQAICDAGLYAYTKHYNDAGDMTVDWWFDAVPAGRALVPRFVLRNTADVLGPVDWVVATDADESIGEISVIDPYGDEVDGQVVQTLAILNGVGGDPTVPPDPVTGEAPRVWAFYQQADHAAHYPTRYQLPEGPNGEIPPGWVQDVPTEPRLHTLDLARFLVANIEWRTWGALGTLNFRVDAPIQAGQRVRFRNPNRGTNAVFPVIKSKKVAGTAGYPLYDISIGFKQLTFMDKLRGGLPDVLLARQELAFQTGTLGSARIEPGHPTAVPLEMTPNHPNRNVVLSQYEDTSGLKVIGSGSVRPNADGTPGTAKNTPSLAVHPPKVYGQPLKPAGFLTSVADGRPHPNAVHLGGFTADGTFPGTFATYRILITAVDVEGGPGSVTLYKDSGSGPVAVAGPFTVGHHILSPGIAYTPRVGTVPADIMSVAWTGTSTVPTYVVVWEA